MFEFQSPEINHLMHSLMAVHKDCGVVINKDRKGHKGTYASLPRVLESIHTMCSKHGLILTQASRIIDGHTALETILRHPASGQWISCQSLLTPNNEVQSADQAWGGSSTYHRRYDAMMLLGIFAEDDPTDHDGAINTTTQPKSQLLISDKQYAFLLAKLNADETLKQKIVASLHLQTLNEIPRKEFNNVLTYIEKFKKTS